MTPSGRDLLLFCRVAAQPEDPDSFPTLSITVSSVGLVPRAGSTALAVTSRNGAAPWPAPKGQHGGLVDCSSAPKPPTGQVVNLARMRPMVPRIDAPDAAFGRAAPAFALVPPPAALGTEYLLLPLGGGVLGAHSLATGAPAAELFLGLPPRA